MTTQERITYITNGLRQYSQSLEDFNRGVARYRMMLHTHLDFVERKLGAKQK